VKASAQKYFKKLNFTMFFQCFSDGIPNLKPKTQIWVKLDGLEMENITTILWRFGNLVVIWYIFSCFGICT
jgi:hypothetical protein